MGDEFRTWPENTQPTAKQLAEWFTKAPLEQRVDMAQRAIDAGAEASRCFMCNHDNLVGEVHWSRMRALRYRSAWLSARRRIHPENLLRGLQDFSTTEEAR